MPSLAPSRLTLRQIGARTGDAGGADSLYLADCSREVRNKSKSDTTGLRGVLYRRALRARSAALFEPVKMNDVPFATPRDE